MRMPWAAARENAAQEDTNWARVAVMQSRRDEQSANDAENKRRLAAGEPRLNPCDYDTSEAALPTDAELDDYLYRQIQAAIGLYGSASDSVQAAMMETLRRFRAGEHMDLPESKAWAKENPRTAAR